MLLSHQNIDNLVSSISSSDDPISKELFDQYAKSLRRGVGSVFADGSFTDLHAQLDANVSRFAAYKAYVATQRIRQAVSANGDIEDGRIEVNKFNRWLAAEYNTAVARSRTAKQWSEWSTGEERSLFPNIMWLPSRSATLREQHIPFYNRVWAKDDPFWNHNQPGTLWNCKCDWQQTDEPVTPNNPNKTVRNQGLEGNPAKTGQIFSDNASYIAKSPKDIEKTCRKIVFKAQQDEARKLLSNKTVVRPEINTPISFSSRGIKEVMNQPCDDYYVKNAIIPYMDVIISNSEYIGKTQSKGRTTEVFSTLINRKKYYILCNYTPDNRLILYSVTESENVLK